MWKTLLRDNLKPVLSNLFWLGVSLILAFMVWFVATIQADPIGERVFRTMTVQITLPEDLTLVNNPTQVATVTLTAQQTLRDSLTREDVTVRAILEDGEPGQYLLPLVVSVAGTESFSAVTQPRQINVTLEQRVTQQKPLQITISNPPAADIAYDEPEADILQVQVSGASSRVEAVSSVRGELDLSDVRSDFSGEVILSAYDIDGRRLADVVIEPRSTFVNVDVGQRDDVRQVAVIPALEAESLPPGYVVTEVSVNPSLIYVGGTAENLAALGENIPTQAIDLSGQESDFETTVPLELSDNILPLEGERSVTVSVGIAPLTIAQQFDNIPIETVGLAPDYTQTISPSTISVVLNGPISIIESLEADDIQAVLNLAGAEPGDSELTPEITILEGEVVLENPQLIPPVLNVSILEASPETTASPEALTSPVGTPER